MKKYKLKIYDFQHEEVFDDLSEAESQQEYLERVQDKICKIVEEEEDE